MRWASGAAKTISHTEVLTSGCAQHMAGSQVAHKLLGRLHSTVSQLLQHERNPHRCSSLQVRLSTLACGTMKESDQVSTHRYSCSFSRPFMMTLIEFRLLMRAGSCSPSCLGLPRTRCICSHVLRKTLSERFSRTILQAIAEHCELCCACIRRNGGLHALHQLGRFSCQEGWQGF